MKYARVDDAIYLALVRLKHRWGLRSIRAVVSHVVCEGVDQPVPIEQPQFGTIPRWISIDDVAHAALSASGQSARATITQMLTGR